MSFRLWCNSIKLWVVAGSNKERDIRGAIRGNSFAPKGSRNLCSGLL